MDTHQPAYKDIAPRLRGLRDAMDMTVEEMAAQLDVPPADVRKYESGVFDQLLQFWYWKF